MPDDAGIRDDIGAAPDGVVEDTEIRDDIEPESGCADGEAENADAAASGGMDAVDRALLDIIQSGFPLVPRPYAEMGRRLGISEEEALERVRSLRKTRIIRRIGANFQSSRLGWVSTLCAAKVPAEERDHFVALVNAEPGVTHNYERLHEYNIWFTFIGPSMEYIQDRLDTISEATGVPILNLPATRLFKIKVDFPLGSR